MEKRWTVKEKEGQLAVFTPDGGFHFTCPKESTVRGICDMLNREMLSGAKQKCIALSEPQDKKETFHQTMVSYLDT